MMTIKKIAWPLTIGLSLALCACGSVADELDGGAMPAEGDEDSDGEMTPDPMTPPDGTEPPEGETDGETEGDTEAECSFLNCDDMGPDGPPECSLFAQDCPAGDKCMPWANDGGSSWNATRCVPISDNPGQPGDECTVEGSGVTGLDDCDISGMCWDVNPETNVGECVPMCTGDSSAPLCEDPDATCSIANNGAIVLCLPKCDPLVQDCADGQACYPIDDDWACAPDASGEMGAAGDPCEYINACDAGNICLGAAAYPDCQGSSGCCTPVCDVEDPAGDEQCPGTGQQCEVWYEEGAAPPGYEAVGACALPA